MQPTAPIQHVYPDWSEKEGQLSAGLEDAQAEVVAALLAETPTPEKLIDVAENAAGFADAMWKKYLHPASPPVACKEGCSWCCYQLVPVSVPEVARIVKFIETAMPAARRGELVERLHLLDKATRGLTSKQRIGIPKPCAYLSDGRCTVYPVRPMACAEFTSYNVQDCKRGKRIGFKPGSVIHEKARMIAYISVQRGVIRGLKQALPTQDTCDLELVAASVDALAAQNSVSSWLLGEPIFKNAHLRRTT